MLVVIATLIAVLMALRDSIPVTNMDLLRKSPVAVISSILAASSGEARGYFYGLSILKGRERDRRVRDWGLGYRLVRGVDARGGPGVVLEALSPPMR